MRLNWRLGFLTVCSLLTAAPFPKYVDLRKNKKIFATCSAETIALEKSECAKFAFNGAPEFAALFGCLKERYHIDVAIETGTSLGKTTNFLGSLFKEVHTIEVNENSFTNYSKQKKSPNIQCHFGNSGEILESILEPIRDKRVVFYLDAHWEQYWPLFDEILQIARTHKDNCIIVVDDFKVPSRPNIPYDFYVMDGQYLECSFSYIKEGLDKVFSDYSIHYFTPKILTSRAKLVVIPKSFDH